MQQGKLFVIEGVDGSGKTTQLNLLIERLESIGKTVKTIHFPRHREPFFGVLVDRYLNGEFGDAAKVDPFLASVLYACDRWESRDTLLGWLSEGYFLVLDRYCTSNKGHQLGKLSSDEEKHSYLAWLDKMEYEVFGIPRPDRVFYLDLPIEDVMRLMPGRGSEDKEYIDGEFDQHENNVDHLRDAQGGYRFTVKQYSYWKQIGCMEGDALLSKDFIHEKIWSDVLSYL